MNQICDVIPILATPFHANGSLDVPSLTRLVEFQLHSGARALAVFGLASETFALSTEERRAVLGTTAQVGRALRTDLCIVAGVAATGIEPAIEQGRLALDHGADALMILPPFMVKPAREQLIEFFAEVAETLQVPVMVQDAPNVTNVPMNASLIAELGRLPFIDYVKVEAAPTAVKVADVVKSAKGTRLRVLGGQNAQFLLDEIARGAIGSMPACDLTDFLIEVLDLWKTGNTEAAHDAFATVLPTLVYGLQTGIAWAVHKEILVLRGVIESARVRCPAQPLDEASRAGLIRAIAPLKRRPTWEASTAIVG